MTVLGVGTDLVDVTRIAKALERHGVRFVEKILSDVERTEFDKYSGTEPNRFIAKRFAVKEAVSKALGTGISKGVDWTDISLMHHESGQPYIELQAGAKYHLENLGATRVDVSLSDEGDLVSAFAVLS